MTYKRLVLSSGSLKGFQYVGLLKCLEEKNLVAPIEEYVGVSIGALFSLLMILNYTSNEIEDLLMNLDLKTLMYPNIMNLTTTYGIVDPKEIITLIKQILIKKNLSSEITMEGLYLRYRKNLVVYSTVLGYEHHSVVIDRESHPNLEVVTAVLMSISIPFIFPPVKHEGQFYIDGGIKNHFPINEYPSMETLGCNLLDIVEEQDTFGNYVQMVYSSIYSDVPSDSLYNIINLRVTLSTVEFFLDNKTKEYLFAQGYEQAKEWFEKNQLLASNEE